MPKHEDYAAIVVLLVQVRGELYIVLVKENPEDSGSSWKIPGGHSKPVDNTPLATALREAVEESGALVPARAKPVHKYYETRQNRGKDAGQHGWYSFCFVLDHVFGLRKPGERSADNEQAGLFPISVVKRMIRRGQFLKSHVRSLEAHLFHLDD